MLYRIRPPNSPTSPRPAPPDRPSGHPAFDATFDPGSCRYLSGSVFLDYRPMSFLLFIFALPFSRFSWARFRAGDRVFFSSFRPVPKRLVFFHPVSRLPQFPFYPLPYRLPAVPTFLPLFYGTRGLIFQLPCPALLLIILCGSAGDPRTSVAGFRFVFFDIFPLVSLGAILATGDAPLTPIPPTCGIYYLVSAPPVIPRTHLNSF